MQVRKFLFRNWLKILSKTIAFSFLGLLIASVAEASERYPSQDEIQRIIREFQDRSVAPPIAGECCGGWEPDTRSQRVKQALESFTRAWSSANPEVVPFLGYWVNNDAEINIYPSNIRGRACVVLGIPEREYHFSQASFSNGHLRITSGRLRNHVFIHQRNSKGNFFLLDAGVYNGRADAFPGNSIYTYPHHPNTFSQLPSSLVQQLNDSDCTAALPDRIYSRCLSSNSYCYQVGDRGPAIRRIIGLLIDQGYYQGNNDGIFGPRTQAAIESLQQDNNLKPDRIAGPSTINILCKPINADDPNLSAQERNRIETVHRNCQEILLNSPDSLN